MKKAVILSLVLLIVISTQVEGKKKKQHGHPKSPPKTGWRYRNHSCFCKGQKVHPTPGHHPTGPHGPPRSHGPHGHHPTGPHGPSRPHGSHGHHPTGPHGSSRPHGSHGHHPTGPYGSSRPHGPHRHHHNGPHRSRPPTRRPGYVKRHRGPHNRGPTRKQVWRKCACRKPDEFKIKFRMIQQWLHDLANSRSEAFRRLTFKIKKMLAKVLNTRKESIYDMRFTKGSIVVEFEVKTSEGMKDPENALKEAIHNGQLREWKIQPESLAVHHSYSGVELSEWKLADEAECDRCGSVWQTRECTEVTASCDGIPLTRNATCYEACPSSRITTCRGFRPHFKMAKVMIIACFIIVGIIIIVAVLVFTKVKRTRRKYLSTSPSTSSIKKLADDGELDKAQSKC